jgi:PAS domain S-box-containing protein
VLYQVVFDFDGTMRFTQVSAAIERINGLQVADVLRDPMVWYGQILPDDLPALLAAERRSAETMQNFDCEARLRRADGSLRRMHFVSAPRRLADGRTVWDGIATDITERSEAQDAQRLLEMQLREAQKMESIGTLASGIAHDFNNVLGAILGNAALARGDVQRGALQKAMQALEQVTQAGQRARNLVSQILTFSRRQVPARIAQPVQPIVDDSLSLLRATLPANVDVAVHIGDPHARAEVDRTQLEQVILNLCTNAWHALGEAGGRIVVGLDLTTRFGEAAVAAGVPPGPCVRLSIEDNGCGMDEATRRRIFEPFFTTKPVGRGTGLGLSVVHGIVTAHDGGITVASTPGQGTRFDVYLPALAPEVSVESAPMAAAHAPGGSGRGERVLYLDDDEIMALMVERLLQRAGFAVHCFTDATAAIDALQQQPSAFDLLVTDYNMPGQSGLDVARQTARLQPGLPVVLSSGSVDDELRAKAHALGILEVVEKQSTLEALAPAIEQALARAARGRRTARLHVVQ